jgi:hypothetical protein
MALKTTTYSAGHFLAGSVYLDFGLTAEVFQGYHVFTTVPTASALLLDTNSPDPERPVQLQIPASTTNPRCFVGISGGLVSGSVSLASAGLLKVGANNTAVNADATGAGNPASAVLRDIAGNAPTGLIIGSNTNLCLTSGGAPNQWALGGATVTGTSVSVFGATNDGVTATPINVTTNSGDAKTAVLLVTIFTLVKRRQLTRLSNYPTLPPAVARLI